MEYRISHYIPVSGLYLHTIYGSVACFLVGIHPYHHKHGSKIKKQDKNLRWRHEGEEC